MFTGRRIALIEDDEIMGGSIAQRLEIEGARVLWLKQAVRALGALRTPREPIDAVICDIRLPDGTGEELFGTLCHTRTPPPFLFITGQGDIGQAVRLMQAGATDYITKPFQMAVFLERLALLLRPRIEVAMPALVGISPAARAVEAMAARAATHERSVLILGLAGTGKGRIARRIHDASDRRAAPFIGVNLARDPDPGHAIFGPGGALERAGDGVIFLGALERLAAPQQARLLDALDDPGFEGRIIAAAAPEIEDEVAAGRLRADLYARLCETAIPIPPLSERPEDAVWLVNRLFEVLNARRPQPLRGISTLAEAAVRAHDWPGNGREVRSRLIRALDLAAGEWIFPADLFPERQAEGGFPTLGEARDAAERRHILAALERSGGQISDAARLLHISRTTLWEKMQRLGL
jgi:DNA-binding NtrC family response regulator